MSTASGSSKDAEGARRPRKVRRRPRPAQAEPADGGSAGSSEPPRPRPRRVRSETIWALVTGLAVGFAVGREVGGCERQPPAAAPEKVGAAAPAATSSHAYHSVAEFPAGWIKDTDVKGGLLAGLSEPQKATVLQALNERNCECGCPFGSIAQCLAKDPHCPRSPALARLAVDTVKAGKGLPAVLAAIDARQVELGRGKAPAAAPTGPVYLPVAAYNARRGPWPAKVTLVEFSDFQ